MSTDDPDDPRRRATPQIGWSQRPKDAGGAALSRSAVTPMPAKLKAAQAAAASAAADRERPSSSLRRTFGSREDRGDRYSDVGAGSVEVVSPPRSQSVVPSTVAEPYDLDGALAPHLAWLEDDGRADLLGQLKRGDHGRALAMLSSAAKRFPRIVSITRATQLVERAAIARLTKRIGDFDSVAVVAGRPGPSHEAISLAALIDGTRTVDEIVRNSSLPRLRTLELLDDLIRRGAVEVRDPFVPSSVSGKSGELPSPRRTTPLATRSPHARPASVPPQRLPPGSAPKPASPKRPTPLAAALAAAAMREIPDLDEDVGARVTIPGPLPEGFGLREPEPSPAPRTVAAKDDGPSIAVEAIDPDSSQRGAAAIDESAKEELPAVLAFGLLSLPVRSPPPGPVSSERAATPTTRATRAETPLPGSVAAATEPQPTLVTPRDPALEKSKDARVKMETLKSAPHPAAVRAAEESDREARLAIEVLSARKNDLERTTESPIDAPKPPEPSGAGASPASSATSPVAEAPSRSVTAAEDAAKAVSAKTTTSDRPPLDRPAARALPSSRPAPLAKAPEVQTIVREATPRWFAPVMVLVGVALIGSAIAVYLSLRNAAEPPPIRDPGPPRDALTASATPTVGSVAVERPSAPPPADLPKVVRVRIDVTPRAARVTLDNVLLTAHPIDEMIPRDGKEHEIRIELAGYETVKKTFTGDGELNLTITLKQTGPTAPPPLPPPSVSTSVPTPNDPKPVTPNKPEEVYPTP